MHAKAGRGRARPLNRECSVRLLACNFHLVTDCDQVLNELDALVQHAAQRHPVSEVHRFEAWRAADGYRLRKDGLALEPRPDARSAATAVYGRMHELALAALPEFTKLHAGCATWGGKRIVIAGPARSGKTTLMTRLLYEGFAAHCDDIVLLRRGQVLPYPRRFLVRSLALSLLPQVAPFAAALPEIQDHIALDPSALGFDWQIDSAPADAVLFLEPDHGGEARLQAYPKYAMAERIMSQSNLPAGGAAEWVRDVCSLVDGAACFVLCRNHLDVMVAAVKEALARANTRDPAPEEHDG